MGKFEKLVVLTVLFVAAIVLAISLNRGSDPVESSDPLSGARERLDEDGLFAAEKLGSELPGSVTPGSGATPALGIEPGATPAEGEAPGLLLSAGLDAAPEAGLRSTTNAPSLTLEPESDPSSRILGDVTGLRPSFLDEYMMYTVVDGDTWSGLAQRFYQDGQYTRNLHLANEDMPELVPGKEILVPVFDFLAEAKEPAQDAPMMLAQPTGQPTGTTPTGTTPTGTAKPEAAPLKPVSSAKLPEYEVRPGDTLSDISLAVFGTAGRWKEILDANTDKLKKPEGLQVGMKLKIPAGGKLPAAGAAKKETKSEPKPKTAQAEKPTSTKKKKVL